MYVPLCPSVLFVPRDCSDGSSTDISFKDVCLLSDVMSPDLLCVLCSCSERFCKWVLLLFTHWFSSRPWRRWRTSPRGGLWSGRRRRRAPVTWARWVTLRHLETRCPGTCPNTIAWSAPSQPPETCWTRQRGPSSALQVRCFTQKEVEVSVRGMYVSLYVLPTIFLYVLL